MTSRTTTGAGRGLVFLAVALSIGCAEDSWAGEGDQALFARGEPRDASANDRTDAGTGDMREAPAPEPISEREVREELARLPPTDELGVRDFQHLLRALPAARTQNASQWVMAHAGHIAMERPGRASQPFVRRLNRQLALVHPEPQPTFAEGQRGECHVDFDDPDQLAALPDQAHNSWAYDPYYFVPCRDGFIRVEPVNFGHYHLSPEDPNVHCIDPQTGTFGRGDAANCVPVDDPTLEPRYLASHDGRQLIRVRHHSGGGLNLPRSFSLRYFINVGGEPVRLRARRGDDWYQWTSLGPYTVWLLAPHADDIDELLISHPETGTDCGLDWITTEGETCPVGGFSYSLDDFAIDP